MARIIWTEQALKDAEEITSFIAKNSPQYAKRFGHKLREGPKRLKSFPEIGWMVPEYENPSFREILVEPYRIIYELRGGDCYIMAVIHGSREVKRLVRPSDGEAPE